jgi:hypothetical protein
MAIGTLVEQGIGIFNELVRMVPAQTEDVARIQWRLRSLARSRPSDTVIGISLLLANLMLGRVAESMRQAEHLWQLRHSMGGDELGIFLNELLHLGMYERVAEILQEIQGQPVEGTIPNLLVSHLRVAWDAGAVDNLEAIVGSRPLSGWQEFLKRLKSAGVFPHLAARQKIIREATFGHQCFSELIFTLSEEDEGIELTHYVYVSEDYERRVAIEESMRSCLDDYFRGVGLGEADHWDLITEILVPVMAGPSWHQDSMLHTP